VAADRYGNVQGDADVSYQRCRRRHFPCCCGEFAAAQDPGPSLPPLENTLPERIDEIRETPIEPLVCFFVQDLSARTDDRTAIESAICENLRRVVRQRLDAQRKQPLQQTIETGQELINSHQ
jgi:hypothetical protein